MLNGTAKGSTENEAHYERQNLVSANFDLLGWKHALWGRCGGLGLGVRQASRNKTLKIRA